MTKVDPSCPAAHAGLQRGDVIEQIDRQSAPTVADFERLAGTLKGEVLLRVHRRDVGFFVVASPTPGG